MPYRRPDASPVLAITGRIRAGKTTLANTLEREHGWRRVAFSDYVRAEAARRGVPETREALQALAVELIEALGWDGFAAAALAEADLDPAQIRAPAVIEGARHLETLDALKRLFAPAAVRVIYLRVSDAERNRRLAAEGVDAQTGAVWEAHSTERQVVSVLPAKADLVVDADQEPPAVVEAILGWVTER